MEKKCFEYIVKWLNLAQLLDKVLKLPFLLGEEKESPQTQSMMIKKKLCLNG